MLCSICHLASAGFSLTQQPRPYLRPSDWWLSCCLKRFTRQLAAEALWVSTHAPEERGRRGGRLAPVTQGGVGLFLGSVIPRGPSGHMVRKLVDSTNVCLKRQGRTPCWVSHRILYKPGGLFWGEERGERVQHRIAYMSSTLMSKQRCDPQGLRVQTHQRCTCAANSRLDWYTTHPRLLSSTSISASEKSGQERTNSFPQRAKNWT